MNIVIRVNDSDGSLRMVHTDHLKLQAVGDMQVKRLSVIEFDHERQQWFVKFGFDPEPVFYAHTREECLKHELNLIHNALLGNGDPEWNAKALRFFNED